MHTYACMNTNILNSKYFSWKLLSIIFISSTTRYTQVARKALAYIIFLQSISVFLAEPASVAGHLHQWFLCRHHHWSVIQVILFNKLEKLQKLNSQAFIMPTAFPHWIHGHTRCTSKMLNTGISAAFRLHSPPLHLETFLRCYWYYDSYYKETDKGFN